MSSTPVRIALALAAIGPLAALALTGCSGGHEANANAATTAGAKPDAKDKGGTAARVTSVLVSPVERRDVPIWIEGLGTVNAWQQVTVKTLVDGRLDKVFFKEGQMVKRGSLLAQIDPRPYLVQLHQAEGALARDKAQLVGTQRDLSRYQQLRKTNLVSQQQVDDQAALGGQQEGAVRTDVAAVESARLNLDYARITSPIDGVIGVRLVDAGNIVHAADATGLLIITQIDPSAVLFTVPQDDLGQIEAAKARGEVVVEAWSRDGATRLGIGKLTVIDNQINQSTATLRLKALMPNHEGKLWPNQFVKARLLSSVTKGALVVPAAAVQRGPQGTFVYVAIKDGDGQKADLRIVDVALTTSETAVLTKGVQPGEQVIVEGQAQLRPGAAVQSRPAPAPAQKGGPKQANANHPGDPTAPGAAGDTSQSPAVDTTAAHNRPKGKNSQAGQSGQAGQGNTP